MIRNYFKIAWRNLLKHKVFSFINVISLSIGLSASFIIGIMVYYDFTFDKFHKDGDSIYRVVTNFESPQGNFTNSGVCVPLAAELKSTVPGISIVAPFYTVNPVKVKSSLTGAEFKNPSHIVYTGKDYFELFQYTWLAGNPSGVLEKTNEVILTQKRAEKYFPKLKPIEVLGKTITYNDSIVTKVTGVVQNFQKRSDLIFEEFISIPTLKNSHRSDLISDLNWGSTTSSSQLFVKVGVNTQIADIQKQLGQIAEAHEDEDSRAYQLVRKFHLQPLQDIHFNATYGIFDYSRSQPDKSVLWGLVYIALFLLLLGCVNFINLNTAQAVKRSKEIGIRKTLGGSKKQLIVQFLGETFLLTILSSLVSFLLTIWLLEVFSDFLPGDLGISVFTEPIAIGILLSVLLIITLLSGFYPALVLSGFKPISVLKNKASSGKKSSFFRSSLTVFQFTVAQIFLVATLLVGKQIHFMMNKNMGFKTDAVAYVNFPWIDKSMDKRKRFGKQIASIAGIEKVSLGGTPPASRSYSTSTITYFDQEKEIHTDLQFLYGDSNYLDTYEIPLLAGRKRLNDTIKEYVINEAYCKVLGFKTPEEAIGKYLKADEELYPIVGVMQDFNQRSLKSKIEPMALRGDWYRSRFSQFQTVHFSLHHKNTENWSAIIKKVENIWKETYPDTDFEVGFMDEMVQNFYKQEYKMSKLLKWATGLAILISALGLLGLVIYTTEKRTKEISIRKILGASLTKLTVLICSEFIKLLGVAFAISIPIAFWWSRSWLQEFEYRTSLSFWIFIISGIGMFVVAILIMGAKVFKTATLNPVKNLRTE